MKQTFENEISSAHCRTTEFHAPPQTADNSSIMSTRKNAKQFATVREEMQREEEAKETVVRSSQRPKKRAAASRAVSDTGAADDNVNVDFSNSMLFFLSL